MARLWHPPRPLRRHPRHRPTRGDHRDALHRAVDAKLTEHWEEIDLLRLMRQLGALG
jgi:hypothetical protein